MELSLEQIKRITVGAACVWQDDGVIKFAKATKKQIDAWMATGYGKSAPTTTGVRLDFHSNTKNFTFATVSSNFRYEVLIDGNSVFFATLTEENDGASLALDGLEHRITLILPFHSVGTLKRVEIDDDASFSPHEFDCKIMFWGDSLTQGWHSTKDSLGYAFRISQRFNAESVILGNGGTCFTPDAVVNDYPFTPDLIVIAYGTNDWGRTPSAQLLRENCKRFLDNICKVYKDTPTIGITPTWRKDLDKPRALGTYADLEKILTEEYAAHGVHIVHGFDLIPHKPELFTDPVHPDDKGFEYYTNNLSPYIQKILGKILTNE